MTSLGWKSVGLLELPSLPARSRDRWVPWVKEADVLLVDGGDATYLCHWMRESGLVDLLPSLDDTVWVGVSAGSMVMTPRIGADFVELDPAGRRRPHARARRLLDLPARRPPGHARQHHGRGRAVGGGLGNPAYALDESSAIRVVDGQVDVISEGTWRHFPV